MIFRLTQRLNTKIKAGRLSDAPLDENPFADWSARLFTADRSQYILLSNTASLYSVVMFGAGITHDGLFISRALDCIRECMKDDGLELIYMNFIAPASASVRFSKALNRSVTGSMNELEAIAKYHLESGECAPFHAGRLLNETPLSAVATQSSNYASPRQAIRQLKPGANDATQNSTSPRSNDTPAKRHDPAGRSTTPKGEDRPACGLCGKTKNLTKTECCGNWVCDDEQNYVMFSYARNSCYRNHQRYTLCGFHHNEGHEGRWQDCIQCRAAFESEMYAYYGTNEHNFEMLPNPPAYEPTHCHQCGRAISLSEDGYSIVDSAYFCDPCTSQRLGGQSNSPEAHNRDTSSDTTAPPDRSDQPNLGMLGEIGMEELKAEVPDAYRDRFDAIVERTDTFCDTHLNDEYKNLCRLMAVAVCQSGSPALKGKPDSWAAGVIYALGRVNFLSDPTQTPHMKSVDIAKGIGVSPGTMQAKAKIISDGLDLMPLDPMWSLPSRMDDNPLVWILEVNGTLMDIRMAPRDAQVVAYEKGLIPYIPADRGES